MLLVLYVCCVSASVLVARRYAEQEWEARVAAMRLQESAARLKFEAFTKAKAEAKAKAKEEARRLRMATIQVSDTESEDHSDAESENSEEPPAGQVPPCVSLHCALFPRPPGA